MAHATFAKFTDAEEAAVARIIARAVALYAAAGDPVEPIHVRMNLSCVHATTPLRLADMADAPDFDFGHDIFGIERHLDKDTGRLGGCFLPRFARPASAVAA